MCTSLGNSLRCCTNLPRSNIRKRNASNGTYREHLRALLDDPGEKLCASPRRNIFADNANTISASEHKVIRGKKPCITQMNIHYVAIGRLHKRVWSVRRGVCGRLERSYRSDQRHLPRCVIRSRGLGPFLLGAKSRRQKYQCQKCSGHRCTFQCIHSNLPHAASVHRRNQNVSRLPMIHVKIPHVRASNPLNI